MSTKDMNVSPHLKINIQMDNALKYTHTKGLTHLKYLSGRHTQYPYKTFVYVECTFFSAIHTGDFTQNTWTANEII